MHTYKTHTSGSINTDGTYALGAIDISYQRLVDVLGNPQGGDGEKVDAEWLLQFDNGSVATIYNYKNGRNYCGSKGLATENITDWRIGGKDPKVVKLVHDLFA